MPEHRLTYRSWRLPANRVEAEDVVGNVPLDVRDVQPHDVLARVLGRRDRAVGPTEEERVVVTLERWVRAEVPRGAHALARRRVWLEEVLREDVGRVQRVQGVHDCLDGLRDDRRPDVEEVVLDRGEGRRERYAGHVE